MGTKGRKWKWDENAAGRKRNSRSMSKRLKAGLVGRSFERKHGMGGTPTYNVWKKIMQRCYQPQCDNYRWYGARGITVCERWRESPLNFLADMGEKPQKCSIERIDVNGNYEKSNCTWLPHRLQSKNRRPWKHSPAGLAAIAAARRVRRIS